MIIEVSNLRQGQVIDGQEVKLVSKLGDRITVYYGLHSFKVFRKGETVIIDDK